MQPRGLYKQRETPSQASLSLATSRLENRVSSSREVKVPQVHLVIVLVHLVLVLVCLVVPRK